MSMTCQTAVVAVACPVWVAAVVADDLRCDFQGHRARAGPTAESDPTIVAEVEWTFPLDFVEVV